MENVVFALALKGGGLRGFATTLLLNELFEKVQNLRSKIKLCAGTSIGAIIAAAIATGVEIGHLEKFFTGYGPRIFTRKWRSRFLDPFSLVTAKYSATELEHALFQIFGHKTIGDCDIDILIPAWRMAAKRGKRAKFFDKWDADLKLTQVTRASAAIPGLFKAYRVENGEGHYMDGGIACNQPCAAARAQLIKEGVPLENIVVLSVGTGYILDDGKELSRDNIGMARLALGAGDFFKMSLEGPDEVYSFLSQTDLGDRYFHLDLNLDRHLALDDLSSLTEIKSLMARGAARQDIENCVKWCCDMGLA